MKLIQRLPTLTTEMAVECYITAVCNGSVNTSPKTMSSIWSLLFSDVLQDKACF